MEIDGLDLLYSLFNQFLYQDVKNNIDSIDYYFNSNPNYVGNTLITSMLDAIRKYSLDAIDLPLFTTICTRAGKTPEETKKIINTVLKYKNYTKDQIQPTRQLIEDICASFLIRKANNLYSSSPSGYLKYLKENDYNITREGGISLEPFNKLNINQLIVEGDPANGVKTGYEILDNSFEPYYVVQPGQAILIAAPPGVGKSLSMMQICGNLALSTKKRQLYLIMGDMSQLDFIGRLCAQTSGLPFGQARLNLVNIYNSLQNQIEDRLDLLVLPAGEITAKEFVDYIINKPYDVIYIDYDSNFKLYGDKKGETMYEAVGEVYTQITRLTKMGKLVFVASQASKSSWNSENGIQMGDLVESSRKMHSSDVILTISKTDCPNNIGHMNLVKNRRGSQGSGFYYRTASGRFRMISKGLHDHIKSLPDKKDFTDQELNQLIDSFERSQSQIVQLGIGR